MCGIYIILLYHCVVCTNNLVLVSFLFVTALYFPLKFKDFFHLATCVKL